MAPEIKKTIDKFEELACENCIYFQDDPSGNSVCINPESDDWHTEKDECCSKGKWLIGPMSTADFKNSINACSYDNCYYEFTKKLMFPEAVIMPIPELKMRREILSLLKRATAVSGIVAIERENYTSEALAMLKRLWYEE